MGIPDNYMSYAAGRESGGDPNAQNPLSSASGLYQFIDGTRAAVARKHGIDPNDDAALMQAFTSDNAKVLSDAGHPTNNTTLYLAHRFGADGALKALNADPNAPVSAVFPNVMRQNPDLRNKRIGDITGGFGGPPQSQPTPQGQGALSMAGPQVQPQPDQGALNGQQVAGGPGALFGTGQTPIGGIAGFLKQLGVGGSDDMGRSIANAGAALRDKDGSGLINANNAPLFRQNFSTFTDPYGRQGVLNHKNGQVTMFGSDGQPVVSGGQPNASGAAPDTATQLAQTPKAMQERLKLDQETSSKKMEGLDDAAGKAQAYIDQNTYAMGLSKDPGVLQGPGLWNQLREKIADNTGGTIGGIDIAKQHELHKINTQLVQNDLRQMPGIRTAAPEIKFGEMGSADSEKPAATNQQIYSQNIQNAKRVIAVRDIARQHMQTRGVLGPLFSKDVQTYQDKNPVYQGDSVKSSPAGSGERPPLSSFQQ